MAMEATAIATGGRFFKVDDPNKLPAIFIREASASHEVLFRKLSVTPSMQRVWSVVLAVCPLRRLRLGAHRPRGHGKSGAGLDSGDEPTLGGMVVASGVDRAITTDAGRVWATADQWRSTDSGTVHVGPCVLVSLEISRCGPIEERLLWRSRRWMKIPLRCCVNLKRWRWGPKANGFAQTSASRSAKMAKRIPVAKRGVVVCVRRGVGPEKRRLTVCRGD